MPELEELNESICGLIYEGAGFLADLVDTGFDKLNQLLESLEDEAPRKGF